MAHILLTFYLFRRPIILEGGISRLEVFSQATVGRNLNDLHSFGCPTYALQSALAAGNSISRWLLRYRLGINLGPSPQHARNIHLTLNLQTGLVSPQYHVKFDDSFESVRDPANDLSSARWKELAGFTTVGVTSTDHSATTNFLEDTSADDPGQQPCTLADNTGDQLPDQETDSTALTQHRTSSGRLRTPNVRHHDYQIYLANVIDYD